MVRRLRPFEIAFLLANLALLLSWFVWATSVTSSNFWLVGGSDALVKTARHPATYRWLLGGAVLTLLCTAQCLLWLLPSRPKRHQLKLQLLASCALTATGIAAIGGLNWALFYDPLDLSVKSAFGGVVLDSVPLRSGEDGPCASSAEVREDEVLIDGKHLPLRWWPIPMEEDGLQRFLTEATCP